MLIPLLLQFLLLGNSLSAVVDPSLIPKAQPSANNVGPNATRMLI